MSGQFLCVLRAPEGNWQYKTFEVESSLGEVCVNQTTSVKCGTIMSKFEYTLISSCEYSQ